MITLGPKTRWLFAVPLGLLILALSLGELPRVYAATITVNTNVDELNNDGDCSLREAIQATNLDASADACTAGSGADTIIVPAGTYTLSITGANEDANATGDLDITGDLTINGAGAQTTIIDGNNIDRVFHAGIGTSVEISGVTVQGGRAFGAGTGLRGGGILVQQGTAFTLRDATLRNNVSQDRGGGIDIFRTTVASILNSTISNNNGGVFYGGIGADIPNITMINSTVSGNRANGAGIGSTNGGTWNISFSTIANNIAPLFDAISFQGAVNATINNTIISGNNPGSSGRTCGTNATSFAGDFNIYPPSGFSTGSGDCADLMSGLNDIETTSTVVDPLSDNGGETNTHPLFAGSLAVDHIPNGTNDCGTAISDDQRAFGRPDSSGGNCDVGAFEFGSASGSPNDLIGEYTFSGNANDTSGNNNHGTMFNGAGLTTDRFGNADSAAIFDGIDDYVLLPIDMTQEFSSGAPIPITTSLDPITFSLWFKTPQINSTVVVLGANPGGGPDFRAGFVGSGGRLSTRLYGGGGPNSDKVLDDNVWHHVVWGTDTDNLNPFFYIDGVLQSQSSKLGLPSGGNFWNREVELMLGARGAPPRNLFGGAIDDVRLYNRALSFTEVSSLFTEIAAPSNQPPDCSGAAIADLIADGTGPVTISGADVTGITDPDGDTLTITVSPTTLVVGSNNVTVTADDGKGGTCATEIIVQVVDNTPPEVLADLIPLGDHRYEVH